MRDQMVSKSDLAQLETRLSDRLEVEITAVRGDIEQVHLRLDSIERALSSRLGHIEAEMSRLRKCRLSARQRQAGHAAPARSSAAFGRVVVGCSRAVKK
jgi:hypothetical protein